MASFDVSEDRTNALEPLGMPLAVLSTAAYIAAAAAACVCLMEGLATESLIVLAFALLLTAAIVVPQMMQRAKDSVDEAARELEREDDGGSAYGEQTGEYAVRVRRGAAETRETLSVRERGIMLSGDGGWLRCGDCSYTRDGRTTLSVETPAWSAKLVFASEADAGATADAIDGVER